MCLCLLLTAVITTTTHTTVVTTTPQQYPRQPTAAPGPPPQPYQGVQYPPNQPMPVQPGYGTPGMPAAPYQAQPFAPGPPPTYQEASEYQRVSQLVSWTAVLFLFLHLITLPTFPNWVVGSWCLFPAIAEREVGYTLDMSQDHHRDTEKNLCCHAAISFLWCGGVEWSNVV